MRLSREASGNLSRRLGEPQIRRFVFRPVCTGHAFNAITSAFAAPDDAMPAAFKIPLQTGLPIRPVLCLRLQDALRENGNRVLGILPVQIRIDMVDIEHGLEEAPVGKQLIAGPHNREI